MSSTRGMSSPSLPAGPNGPNGTPTTTSSPPTRVVRNKDGFFVQVPASVTRGSTPSPHPHVSPRLSSKSSTSSALPSSAPGGGNGILGPFGPSPSPTGRSPFLPPSQRGNLITPRNASHHQIPQSDRPGANPHVLNSGPLAARSFTPPTAIKASSSSSSSTSAISASTVAPAFTSNPIIGQHYNRFQSPQTDNVISSSNRGNESINHPLRISNKQMDRRGNYDALLQDIDDQFNISQPGKGKGIHPPPLARLDSRSPPVSPPSPLQSGLTNPSNNTWAIPVSANTVDKFVIPVKPSSSPHELRRERDNEGQEIGGQSAEAHVPRLKSEPTDLRRPKGPIERVRMEPSASRSFTAADVQDERIIVPDYIKALRTVIKSDAEYEITPEDFQSMDGYTSWKSSVRASFHDVISQLLKSRFLDPLSQSKNEPKIEEAPMTIFLKIAQAEGLTARENKARDAYCTIEYGDPIEIQNNTRRIGKSQERFMTEIVKNTLNPIWDQHMKIPIWNEHHLLVIKVWDNQKEHFLGCVELNYKDVIRTCAKDGFLNRWFSLKSDGQSKEKHIGGELYLQMTLQNNKNDEAPTSSGERGVFFIKQLSSCRVNLKSLYTILVRCCLALDMKATTSTITENTAELFSPESLTLLFVYCREWTIQDAAKAIIHLELLFNKFKAYEIPTGALLSAYEKIYEGMKSGDTWLGQIDRQILIGLLDSMNTYYISQLTKYKELYPKNMPRGALETTILMLRMIHKNPLFRATHTNLKTSFRDELRDLMTTSCFQRFQRFKELSLPLDESDIEEVFHGTYKLADLIVEDIDADTRYFKKPFAREFDIEKLNAECLCKQLVVCFNEIAALLASDHALQASKIVFDLYRSAVKCAEKFAPFLPVGNQQDGFTVEDWFGPFIFKWINGLSTKTLEWVQSAIKNDNFEGIIEPSKPTHSSSVRDVFQALHSELDFIQELNWSDVEQYSQFYQAYAKTVYDAILTYSETMSAGEFDASVPTKAWGGLVTRNTMKTDIENSSCVKLCNVNYAVYLLDEMYKKMMTDGVIQKARTMRVKPSLPNQESVCGAFTVQVVYADQLKPSTTTGLANAFVRICVPDGTVVPPIHMVNRKESKGLLDFSTDISQMILRGSACEIVRSCVIYDSINPTWEETFETNLPPVQELLLEVLSKNMLTEPTLVGSAVINLSSDTKLYRKLTNHQTHDVIVELEPQGRILLRFTLAGVVDDVDFWFRKARERLGRTRDDFLRALTLRTAPYAREVIMKAIKDQEAVLNRTFLSTFTGATELSNLTASGASIDNPVDASEADQALTPLTDYFNKNLEILCISLSPKIAQEVIKRIWEEIMRIVEDSLVPNIYGIVEKDRKLLNRRQCSMADLVLKILKEFFHADGEGLGLAIHVLETRKFIELTTLISIYNYELIKLKREYELGLSSGREKEYVLKLLRLKCERGDSIPAGQKDDLKGWIDVQLERRRLAR